jgi:periplasmic protein TonB
MHDAISDALHGRMHEPERLKRMLLVSAAAHIVLMVLSVLAPASWWQRPSEAPNDVMTISLGPTPGPRTGGMTSIGSRPVQQAVRDTPKPTPPVKRAPMDAPGRTAAVGSEERGGETPRETGPQSAGVGLSTGDGGTGTQFNAGTFCCPEYIAGMLQGISTYWSARQAIGGVTTMRFTIERDGTLTDIRVVRSSGNQMLDFLAQRALLAMRKLPPLPDAYPHSSLVVNLDFEYQR